MYEQSTSAVTAALTNSSSNVFNAATIDRILSLTTNTTTDTTVTFDQVTTLGGAVTVAEGTEVVHINSSPVAQTTIVAPQNVPVVIFEGLGGVNATFNDGATTVQSAAGVVDRVVVHSAGADNIVISDAKNSQIVIGANDTVVGGAGNDTVVAGSGNSTVVSGTGYTIVELDGKDTDYTVTVVDGHAIVKNKVTGVTTDTSGIDFVQLDNGDALVFAENANEAAVATLYETTFGRAADAQGLKYWFDLVAGGTSIGVIADVFTQTAEFQATQAKMTDAEFVSSLYQNTFGRAADAGGLEYWVNALEAGYDRGDILDSFATIAAQHIEGSLEGEATIIGSVTFIPGTIA